MSDLRCPVCMGRGWVLDGQPEDGMMTGRMDCPLCHDPYGRISEERLREYTDDLWKRARS